MRIAFQCPVVEADALTQARAGLGLDSSTGWTPESPLHVTVLHLGRVEELGSEIRERLDRPSVNIDSTLRRFANAAAKACPDQSITLQADAVNVWTGGAKSYAVLLFPPPDTLLALRCTLEERFLSFLSKLGIREPQVFLENSKVIGFRKPWTPHLTLAYGSGILSDARIAARGLETLVEFEIGRVQPSSYSWI